MLTKPEENESPILTVVKDESQIIQRKLVQQAVKLAMEGLWDKAGSVNRQLIDLGFGDVETWNRLGKAMLESDDRDSAREAFQNALSLSPSNVIARKNLERLTLFERNVLGLAKDDRSLQVSLLKRVIKRYKLLCFYRVM